MDEANETLKKIVEKLDRKLKNNSSEVKDNELGVEVTKVQDENFEASKKDVEIEVELEDRVNV